MPVGVPEPVPELVEPLLPSRDCFMTAPRCWLFDGVTHEGFKTAVRWRWGLVGGYLAVCAAVLVLVGSRVGTQIFPSVDTGQFMLRLRAPTGTRIERTEEIIRLMWEIEKKLDTVVALGVGTRCDEHGEENIVAPILERLGYKLERAKTNAGLGRVNHSAIQRSTEAVNV